MLAGEGAAEAKHQIEGPIEADLGPRRLVAVVGINEQIDMNIAVAGVTEIDNTDTGLLGDCL